MLSTVIVSKSTYSFGSKAASMLSTSLLVARLSAAVDSSFLVRQLGVRGSLGSPKEKAEEVKTGNFRRFHLFVR